MKKEIWKWIPLFIGKYEVSNLGNIRGWFYGGKKRKAPRIKIPQENKNGYLYVILQDGELLKSFTVHRLTLSVFDKPMPRNIDCRHIDGNKRNCKLTNLCWGTRKQNEDDKRLHGRMPTGEKNGESKVTEKEVLTMRKMFLDGESTHSISKKFKCGQQNVWNIVNNKTWKHI